MSNQSQSVTTACGITVTAEAGIDLNIATAAKPFTDWLAQIDRKRFNVRNVHIQSVDMFGPRVGFIKFKADVADSQGRALPGIIFARGGAVAVLAVLVCEGKAHAVVTVQPRLATGDFEFVETCAGMLDGSGNFAGVAAKELKEELHIELAPGELVDLGALAGFKNGIYLTPGGSEETMRFFAFCREVSRTELDDINGRLTGALDEGEQITLKLVNIDDLAAIPDAKTIIAHSLYQRFKDKIPGTDKIKSSSTMGATARVQSIH